MTKTTNAKLKESNEYWQVPKNAPKGYTAGKMRGLADFGKSRFQAVTKHFRELGYEVRSPDEKDAEDGFDGNLDSFDMHKAMQWDLEAVLWADYIFLLPGWETSQGVAMETAVARVTGKIPVICVLQPIYESETEFFVDDTKEYTWEEIDRDYPDRITLNINKLLGITQKEHEEMIQNAEIIPVIFPHEPVKINSPLDEALVAVHGERGVNYGHPFEDFSRTALIWQSIKGIEFTPEDVALMMVAVKMSRLVNTPGHWDSMVDICGYTETYHMVRQYRKDKESKEKLQEFLDTTEDIGIEDKPFWSEKNE